MLPLIGAAEKSSEYPLAQAIVNGIIDKGIMSGQADIFKALTGYGVKATAAGRKVLIGTHQLMHNNHIDTHDAAQQMVELEQSGKTAMLVAIDEVYVGIIAVADTVKATSCVAIQRLQAVNIETSLC